MSAFFFYRVHRAYPFKKCKCYVVFQTPDYDTKECAKGVQRTYEGGELKDTYGIVPVHLLQSACSFSKDTVVSTDP